MEHDETADMLCKIISILMMRADVQELTLTADELRVTNLFNRGKVMEFLNKDDSMCVRLIPESEIGEKAQVIQTTH